MLANANVLLFPFQDEVNGHIVFKSQFIKDAKMGEEVTWWVPNLQAQGRVVRMPIMNVKERQQYLLETKFREQHGARIRSLHEAAVKKLGPSGYLEKRFADSKSQRHLDSMYQLMQRDQSKLSTTTIFMKRLRYFAMSPEEIEAGEPQLPQQEVKQNFLSYHHNYHHIISLS